MLSNYKTVLANLQKMANVFSSDPQTKVGCQTTINGHTIYGYNTLVEEVSQEDIINRTPKFYEAMQHSEPNMLAKLQTNQLLQGEVYVTLYPCINCARKLVSKGVTKIVTQFDTPQRKEASYIKEAIAFFEENNVEVIIVE